MINPTTALTIIFFAWLILRSSPADSIHTNPPYMMSNRKINPTKPRTILTMFSIVVFKLWEENPAKFVGRSIDTFANAWSAKKNTKAAQRIIILRITYRYRLPFLGFVFFFSFRDYLTNDGFKIVGGKSRRQICFKDAELGTLSCDQIQTTTAFKSKH